MAMTGVPPVRALAWDPTGAATLALCPLPSHGRDDIVGIQGENSINLDVFLSHDGTGCSPEETECLLTCLDARDAWLAAREQQRHQHHRRPGTSSRSREYPSSSSTATVAELSMNYRAAMCKCLMQLQEKAARRASATSTNGDDGDNGGTARNKTNPIEDANNMELLTLTYSISHLVEIFLLPSLADSASSNVVNGESTGRRLENGPAGSLTADTVRYLRLHHSRGGSFMELPQVQRMLECDQPEYYRFPAASAASSNNPTNENDSIIIPGPFEFPFWNLLLQFVIEGELCKAWNLLSHHSACRHAAEEEAANSPEGRGFEILQRILLSAPLPGGRGDNYCDDSGLDDYLEEEMLEREEEDEANLSSSDRRLGLQQHHEVEDAGEDGLHVDYMDGVSSNAYLLWETLPRRADKIRTMRYRHNLRLRGGRTDDDNEAACDARSGSPTVPELYQPRVALNTFRVWQETIREIAFPGGIGIGSSSSARGELASLFRRFPPLQQIISILVGVVPPSIANSSSLSWSGRLLMELLYSRPDILPEDIAVRAKVAMGAAVAGAASQTNTLTKIILSIMQGGAGEVIQTLFSVCGGSSGAALPATMTSLICNLLVDAGCMPPVNNSTSSKVNIQTELLLLASEAIASSFSIQEQSSVGVRTAIRLLLPHAPAKRAVPKVGNKTDPTQEEDIIYEPRISSMIAEVLSHRLPATDAEARDLMGLCEEVIGLGSVVIADACESLAICRALHHGSNDNLMQEAYWLLRGMEIQSCWLPSDRQRVHGYASRRNFDSLCERSANSLISTLSISASAKLNNSGLSDKQEKVLSSVIRTAKELLDGIMQDDTMAPVLKGHMESNLLKNAVNIALADAEGDSAQVASNIIYCLEERCLSDDYGGVVSTLADPKMYSELLNIAFAITEQNDRDSSRGPMEFAKCDFTLHGMQILMARLTQVSSWNSEMSNSREDHIMAMRLAFCKGLMRLMLNNQPAAKSTVPKAKRADVSLDDELTMLLSPRI